MRILAGSDKESTNPRRDLSNNDSKLHPSFSGFNIHSVQNFIKEPGKEGFDVQF